MIKKMEKAEKLKIEKVDRPLVVYMLTIM